MPGIDLNQLSGRDPRDADHDGIIAEGTPAERRVAQPVKPTIQPTRGFTDPAAVRDAVYNHALDAAKSIQPVSNASHTITVSDPRYENDPPLDIAAQKRAILEGGTLGRKLRATFTLKDNATGEVVDSKRSTLAFIPHFTERGTIIRNGSEFSLANQMRLKPGVYTRRKENGELESHLNLRPGTGLSSRVFMEPETGRFRLGVAQAQMPLLPLLRAMGATDSKLHEAWGRDIAYTNMLKDDPTVIDKLNARLTRGQPAADHAGRSQAVANAFAAMPLDPDVTEATLGARHDKIDLDTLLATTKKLIAVHRGEAQPDDRDDIAFMTMHGPEDLISERLAKASSPLRLMLWKASRQRSLKSLPSGLMNRAVDSALLTSGLGQSLEEVNPSQILDQQSRVSRLGVGGIPSTDSVPASSRNVQQSQLGFIDPVSTPESLKAGVDGRVASKVRKGPNGEIYSDAFRDARTGAPLSLTPKQASKLTIAFPGELASGEQFVDAQRGGKTVSVPRNEVDAELTYNQDLYNPITLLVPLFSAVKPQRTAMATRMITQALPLANPESPLVQAGIPGSNGDSYERNLGAHMGALRSPVAGTVESVTHNQMTVRGADGKVASYGLYDNFPLNRKTLFHQSPIVKPGDQVVAGQLLARSNYTDANGITALGRNTRIAYVPFAGVNYEDAAIISESFAKRLSSEHMYQHTIDRDDTLKVGKAAHTSIFPGKYSNSVLTNFDDDGVIKPGTTVHHGDPLILAAKEREQSAGSIHKSRKAAFSDATETWDHHADGVVTDVAKTPKGILVAVKSYAPAEVGDKLSGLYGDKGVIARIVPDHEMPHDANGIPFEAALNPLGTISRVNPAQHIAGALGKIAAITGQPYAIVDFDKKTIPDLTEFAANELRRHGLDPSSTEKIYDPVKRRWIRDPFTGGNPQTANRYIMKLHHTSESKLGGRGTGNYTAEAMPSKGGEGSSKRMSIMDLNALLSHGATSVISDVAYRGQAQPELWAQVMAGHTPPTPKVPHVLDKFYAQLTAAGIHPLRTGTRTQIMAMTNQDVEHLTEGRELQNAETVDWKAGLKPVKGGLFSPELTGGSEGNRWSSLTLHEPMLNPVMEEPARRLLGLTEKAFREVLAGRERLGAHGTGPEAIKRALGALNVSRELDRARADVVSGRKGVRDLAVRRLGVLKTLDRLGMKPEDWVWDKVPVLPPKFRPVSVMKGNNLPLVADANALYRDLFDANSNLKDVQAAVGDTADERLAVYDALKAVVGLGDPVNPKSRDRQVRGVLKHVFAHTPKFSTVQRKLLGSTVDLVGRAVIAPDPDLDMDEAGIPEDGAWASYKPFIVRRLVRNGVPRMRAVREVTDRTPTARQALVTEMDARPVILTRAPVLHRYGVMAFRPKLIAEGAIKLPPLVYKGYGADNDGDAMTWHVPASDEAVQDAYDKMLPSRNLLSTSDFKAHQLPSQEYVAGLYSASKAHNKNARPATFATLDDVVRAYHRGDITVDQPVRVLRPS